jgi:uncharacterized glyoxalase superfamily protein PhnB
MNQSVFPNLVVRDIEVTLPWYQRNLNAEVKMTVPSQADSSKACFATIVVAGNDIMLQTVDNIEEKYPQLKGQVALP